MPPRKVEGAEPGMSEYRRGIRDFHRGVGRRECPFRVGSSDRTEWLRGWYQANKDEPDTVVEWPLGPRVHQDLRARGGADVEVAVEAQSFAASEHLHVADVVEPEPAKVPRGRGRPRVEGVAASPRALYLREYKQRKTATDSGFAQRRRTSVKRARTRNDEARLAYNAYMREWYRKNGGRSKRVACESPAVSLDS